MITKTFGLGNTKRKMGKFLKAHILIFIYLIFSIAIKVKMAL